ncbi:MAG: XRE family transcriptional regulator [Rhodospirillaceae bacterium]
MRAENINPAILSWARETAGLSLGEAAEKLGLSSGPSGTAAEKLEELERGQHFPTRIQLLKFATVYRRPLTTFYLKHPPVKAPRGADFRTLPAAVSTRDNALLDALLRDIRARQEMVRSLLEDEGEAIDRPFVGSVSVSDGVQAVGKSIGAAIGFDITAPRRHTNPDDLFRELRNRVEAIGVFVLLIGDLGSHHSMIGEKVFRGLVIADPVAPFIVINDQDAKAARSFTLLHELAHIWLGKSGVSGAAEDVSDNTPSGQIEQFCNDVAGEFLLPSHILRDHQPSFDGNYKEAVAAAVGQVARDWGVSEAMVAYRFNRFGWITGTVYRELAGDYAARWHAVKAKQREKARETEGGPTFYVVRRHKLGHALLDIVRRNLRDDMLTHTKAAKVLGINPGAVEPMLRGFEQGFGGLTPDGRR